MLTGRLSAATSKLDQLWRVAQSLHPNTPLKRGYARIEKRSGGVITSAEDARMAGALTLHFADGQIDAKVERSGPAPYTAAKANQGDLF
jgi:exodeoxyribonuclease VII large subunit